LGERRGGRRRWKGRYKKVSLGEGGWIIAKNDSPLRTRHLTSPSD